MRPAPASAAGGAQVGRRRTSAAALGAAGRRSCPSYAVPPVRGSAASRSHGGVEPGEEVGLAPGAPGSQRGGQQRPRRARSSPATACSGGLGEQPLAQRQRVGARGTGRAAGGGAGVGERRARGRRAREAGGRPSTPSVAEQQVVRPGQPARPGSGSKQPVGRGDDGAVPSGRGPPCVARPASRARGEQRRRAAGQARRRRGRRTAG